MIVKHDVRQSISKIDEEIIRLLSERVSLTQEILEEDPDVLSAEYQTDVVAQWDEAADEHGWNPAHLAKICRGILDLSKHAD